MLGKRKPQYSFFDAIGLPHRVSPNSFYGHMGSLTGKLLRDDDLKDMYCAENGRPSLPPSMMAGAMILQFYDDVSDGEAVERIRYDLRWKVALNLGLDYDGFDASSLSVFRARLVKHKQERYAFDRLLSIAREEGFLIERYHQCERCRSHSRHLHLVAQRHPQATQDYGLSPARQASGLFCGDREIAGDLRRPGSQS